MSLNNLPSIKRPSAKTNPIRSHLASMGILNFQPAWPENILMLRGRMLSTIDGFFCNMGQSPLTTDYVLIHEFGTYIKQTDGELSPKELITLLDKFIKKEVIKHFQHALGSYYEELCNDTCAALTDLDIRRDKDAVTAYLVEFRRIEDDTTHEIPMCFYAKDISYATNLIMEALESAPEPDWMLHMCRVRDQYITDDILKCFPGYQPKKENPFI